VGVRGEEEGESSKGGRSSRRSGFRQQSSSESHSGFEIVWRTGRQASTVWADSSGGLLWKQREFDTVLSLFLQQL